MTAQTIENMLVKIGGVEQSILSVDPTLGTILVAVNDIPSGLQA
jgi:hypothetical protein